MAPIHIIRKGNDLRASNFYRAVIYETEIPVRFLGVFVLVLDILVLMKEFFTALDKKSFQVFLRIFSQTLKSMRVPPLVRQLRT